MLLSSIRTISGLAIASLAIFGYSSSAQAFSVYFGEDINPNPDDRTQTFDDIVNSRAAEANFLADLSRYATEDFESYDVHTGPGFEISFGDLGTATLSGGGVKSMVKTVDESLLDDPNTPDALKDDIAREIYKGRNASSGTQYWLTNAQQNFTVNFSKTVNAFGFYGYDLGDYQAQTFVDLYSAGQLVSSVEIPNRDGANASTNGSAFYFGLMADSADLGFDQAIFRMNNINGDEFAFDDFTVGASSQTGVPEPFSMVGGAIGLGLFGLGRRKRH